MRPLLAFALLIFWITPSSAQDVTGRVRGIFHEASRGVVVVQVTRGIDAGVGDLAVLRNSRITRIVPATRLAKPAG